MLEVRLKSFYRIYDVEIQIAADCVRDMWRNLNYWMMSPDIKGLNIRRLLRCIMLHLTLKTLLLWEFSKFFCTTGWEYSTLHLFHLTSKHFS